MSAKLPVLGKLPADWDVAPLGELLSGGTRNGIYKPKKHHGSGTKIVNMGELFGNPRLRDIPMRRLELTESEKSRFSLQTGDLLFARRSLVNEGAGKCIIVMDLEEETVFESSIIRARPDGGVADSLFLFYLFNSPFGRYSLGTIRREMAVAGITGADLQKLSLPVPPLPTQKSIAHILGMLDDKIELNRRMNQTLEAITRAIFKSWFIDFDPVIDNALASGKPIPEELRKRAEIRTGQNQPSPLPSPIGRGWQKAQSDGAYGVISPPFGRGGGDGVADQSRSASGRGARGGGAVDYHRLFPDEFQDSPLGKIPKGWEVGRLEEHIGFALGGDWGKETPDELHTEPVYCIRGTDLASLQQGELPGLRLRYLKPSSLEKRTLRPFDVVFEVSGGSPTQSTGRSLLINETLLGSYDEPLVCTNFCRLVRFTSEGMALFVSFLLDRFYSAGEFFAHETGTTTNSQNGVQSDSLSKIRDTLLPPLLSGRIAGPCDGTQGENE
jgi:hypothetical protein